MAKATVTDLNVELEQLQRQMAEIFQRIETLEKRSAGKNGAPAAAMVPPPPVIAPQVAEEPVPSGITEEEVLAISAAIGAFLGVRAHIRQIRLLSTSAWAQQGRVSIQASHSLQG